LDYERLEDSLNWSRLQISSLTIGLFLKMSGLKVCCSSLGFIALVLVLYFLDMMLVLNLKCSVLVLIAQVIVLVLNPVVFGLCIKHPSHDVGLEPCGVWSLY